MSELRRRHNNVAVRPPAAKRVGGRCRAYLELMRLHQPIGILLLLWPTLWALWLAAEGPPPAEILLIFVAGTLLMRSAGCVINDYFDRHYDQSVERTRQRPLVRGRVSERGSLLLAGALALFGFLLVLRLNELTILLAIGGAMLTVIYPLLKRFTYLPQAWLGMAFGWGIPMAWAAVTGTVPRVAWLLFIGNVFWTISYDTIYAMVDRDDDLRIGVKSTAVLFAEQELLAIAVLQASMLLTFFLVGMNQKLGSFYYLALLLASLLACAYLWEIRQRDRQRCFRAFLASHWLGATLFAGIFLHYYVH